MRSYNRFLVEVETQMAELINKLKIQREKKLEKNCTNP